MAKNVKTMVKLQLTAGKAAPSPPVGPALGQHGVNLMDFCKQFNALTEKEGDTIIPVVVTVYDDRTFTFITKTPPASVLIKKELKLKSGSKEPNKVKVGKLTEEQLERISTLKMQDLNAYTLESAKRIIRGTARSMGVECE